MNLPSRLLSLALIAPLFVPPPVLQAQSARGAWSGADTYAVGDSVTYLGNTYIDIQATGPITQASGGNLFNPATINFGYAINSDDGSLAHYGGTFEATDYIPVPSGGAFVTNITVNTFPGYPNFGIGFYDSNRYFTTGVTNVGSTNSALPGVPIAVPNGSSFVRFWYVTGAEGTSDSGAIVNQGTTLQSTYTPYGAGGSNVTTPSASPTDTTHWSLNNPAPAPAPTPTPTPTPAPAPIAPGSLPLAGKKIFCLGDSILYANPTLCANIATKLGATLSSNGASGPGVDAQNGRTFDSFTYLSPGTPGAPVSPATLADVDVLVLMLGTDQDSPSGIGSLNDSPSLNGYATMTAQMRGMLESILQWKLGIRIVVVGPYQSNRYNLPAGNDGLLGNQDPGRSLANPASLAILRNINTSMRAVCELYSIPYIDLYNTSGVNFTTSALWLTDGLHPNALGYSTFYIPTIGNALARYAFQ